MRPRRTTTDVSRRRDGRIRVPTVQLVEAQEEVRGRANRRVWMIAAAFGIGLAVIGVRGAHLCLQPDDRTLAAASVQRWEQMQVRARRGDILDREGRRLVSSADSPNVVLDPGRVAPPDRDAVAAHVADLLHVSLAEVHEHMARDTRYAKLASGVHPAVAQQIEDLGESALFVERAYRRYYPEQGLAAHVLGFVDVDGEGVAGLEKSMDDYLRGASVLLQRRRDRHGLDVDRFTDVDRGRSRGLDVYTTLDRRLQRVAERALEGVAERTEPKSSTAIVVDVRTGDLLALANWPPFNPNALDDDPAPRRNHAIQDAIEPGSVFKPFTILAAMEEGQVHAESKVDCEGGRFRIGRSTIGDDHPKGVITVAEIIKYSNNIGTAKQALKLGGPTLIRHLRDFGFASPSGVPLGSERAGFLRDPETIKRIEIATTAYGQGATATPLQLAYAYAAIANGGLRMKPRLVTRVVDEFGVPEVIIEPEIAGRVASEANALAMSQMLVGVTERGGTATRAAVEGYHVAGKTGTAWKVQDGRYGSARIGSFVGFLPADRPEVAIAVVVDEPTKGSRFGGIVAAPAFREIATAAMHHLGIAPNPDPADEDGGDAIASVDVVEDTAAAVLVGDADAWLLPDLTGRSQREALVALQGSGLAIRTTGHGFVVQQSPQPGTRLRPGSEVAILLR